MRGGRALVTIPKFESLIFPPSDPFKYRIAELPTENQFNEQEAA
jgi:hypothetical protein